MRNAAMRIAEGLETHVRIGEADLEQVPGPPRFENQVAMRTAVLRRGHGPRLDACRR